MITSYFFPISKGKDKQPSSSGSVTRTTPEGKRPRPTPYPETSSSSKLERKSTTILESNSSSESNPNPDTTSFTNGDHPRYKILKQIADDTIEAIEHGSYELAGATFDLQVSVTQIRQGTEYWSPEAKTLVDWAGNRASGSKAIEISVLEISTLEGARFLDNPLSPQQSSPDFSSTTPKPKIGVLNFASATKPGGGFLNGASAQEESIARSSTLYYSLTTKNGDEFYKLHKRMKYKGKWKGKGKGKAEEKEQEEEEEQDKGASSFYTHAMIYSPSVLLFRDDSGSWLEPLAVDILTSAAVNAGDVRTKNRTKGNTERNALESRIETEMKERMGRILRLFVLKGVRNLVLGSFGTGVFRNNVEVVAGLWKELLVGSNAPFQGSFDRVVFAVLGKGTYESFQAVFGLDVSS